MLIKVEISVEIQNVPAILIFEIYMPQVSQFLMLTSLRNFQLFYTELPVMFFVFFV